MLNTKSERFIREIMQSLDIQVDGERPWDVRIHNPLFYKRVATQGSLGLGEAYMDGWWDCDALDELFYRLLRNKADEKTADTGLRKIYKSIKNYLVSVQNQIQRKTRAFIIGQHHYDLGNELFSIMLDKGLNYSCAYWHKAENLQQAQTEKLDLICRKIGLKPGMEVLDIGCGWGGFARHAAQNYGVKVTGVTVSKEQADYARNVCKELDVTVELVDYRQVQGKYDRVVSVGMFEHVGWRNYRRFMDKVHQVLDNSGLFLLHTIGSNDSLTASDPWIGTYIFPHSMIPSVAQICRAAERRFIVEDWHNFGLYYDSTLMVWYKNFVNNYNKIKERYDLRFFRMWTYYLLVSAASFRARKNQLWQIVFSKQGLDRVFRSEGELFP
ncbi:MAG: cyclopropane-fatty-acyl-phospholipid synthase [Deltaproteobacteria bacterium]|nr:MAG: cyclopropane-fatty-acyl-phospholipid synthase [Deltaproteobacteria bacterium]